MTASHQATGHLIELRPASGVGDTSKSVNLLKTARMEIIRLALPQGKELPSHIAPGEMTVQCLGGTVEFTVGEQTHRLQEGQLLHLEAREAHAVRSDEDSLLLLTIIHADEPSQEVVQEASEESFPASDAPAWTGVTGTQK